MGLTALRREEARAHFLRLNALKARQAIVRFLGVEDQSFLPQADRMLGEVEEFHSMLLEKLEAAIAAAGKTQ